MRLLILRSRLINGQLHQAGDVVEVDDATGRAIVHSGGGSQIRVTGPDQPDDPSDSVGLRQAVLPPSSRRKTRKVD